MEFYAHLRECLAAFVVILPVILFWIVMRYFIRRIKENQINLLDLLEEPDVQPKVNKSKEGESQASAEPIKKRSTSRFILFVTAITTLVLTVCFTSYYFYIKVYAINGGADPDLAGFTNVLLALGIGVIPYSVNQVKKVRL